MQIDKFYGLKKAVMAQAEGAEEEEGAILTESSERRPFFHCLQAKFRSVRLGRKEKFLIWFGAFSQLLVIKFIKIVVLHVLCVEGKKLVQKFRYLV